MKRRKGKKQEEPVETDIFKSKNVNDEIKSLFPRKMFYHMYNAWLQDCGDKKGVDSAKYFRDELITRNNKDSENFNFRSIRAGKQFLITFASNLETGYLNSLDLSDNSITDMCMHTIKSLIEVKGL